MHRYLVIVARQRRDLHAYLAQQFAGDDSVRVLVERRSAERRGRWERHDPERRRRDRRLGSPGEAGLSCHGLMVLRAPSPQAPALQDGEARSLPAERGAPAASGAGSPAEAARRWIIEGRRRLPVLLALLAEQGYLEGRIEALEQKFAALDGMIRRLQAVRFPGDAEEPGASAPGAPPGAPADPGRPTQP